MRRLAPAFLVFVSLLSVADHSVAQQTVKMTAITPKIKLEEVISGHVAELNGKFKLRVTELTFEPGGYLPAEWKGPSVIES